MMRRKQTFLKTVRLYLNGPKWIFSEPVTADARMSHTWFEFLNGELGLENPYQERSNRDLTVAPQSRLFVCTANYTPSALKEGRGWRSELNEEIGEFIKKFERKLKQFSVRLCHPNDILVYAFNHSANASGNGTSGSPPTTTSGDHPRPHADVPTASGPSPSTRGPSHAMNGTLIMPPDTLRLHPNQRPNIPTTGLMGPPPPPGPKTYEKPRYNNTNGLPSRQTKGNTPQQQTYGTRQKRHHEQSETLPETTLRSAGGKQRRVDDASTTSNIMAPIFVASLSDVKVEPVVELQWDEFCDESSSVDGQGGGVNGDHMNGDEVADATTDGEGRHQEEEFTDDSDGSGAADEEESDNLSLMTAATAEENELRKQGIRVEDVKSLVEGRMTRFSNAYMLRVRNEIGKLRKNNLWDRNVNRAPLACYLLQEVFRV